MFDVFSSMKRKSASPVIEVANETSICRTFYREQLRHGAGVFIEVKGEREHRIYVSNYGVTPPWMRLSYDEWCHTSLLESYVFDTMDSAVSYFQSKKSEHIPDIVSAIRKQIQA